MVEIDGYTELERIGRGGFGTVYRATEVAFARPVALKVLELPDLDDEQRRRFERECQATGAVSDHPNIVTVHGAGFTADGRPFIAMEYMPGGSVADRLREHGPYPWEDAVDIGARVAGALATAHAASILHRDIKPENILVSAYDEPCLGDFGIARLPGATLTRSGVVTASVPYAPPEILDGREPSAASDVWSLTATLYALILGHPPFGGDGDTVAAMIGRIATQPPPDLRDAGVPDVIVATLERGLAKSPDERYATADAFAAALRDAQAAADVNVTAVRARVDTPPVPVEAETRVRTVDRPTGRRRVVIIGGATLGVAALVATAFALSGNGGGSPEPDPTLAASDIAATAPAPTASPSVDEEPTSDPSPTETGTEAGADGGVAVGGTTGGSGGAGSTTAGIAVGEPVPPPVDSGGPIGTTTGTSPSPTTTTQPQPTATATATKTATPTTSPTATTSPTPANRKPTLSGGGDFTASEMQTVNRALTGNDPDGDQLTYSITAGSLPPGLSLNGSTITGTVNRDAVTGYSQGATQQYSATITARDPGGLSDNERVTYTITNTHFAMPDYAGPKSYGDGGDGLPSVGSGIYNQRFACTVSADPAEHSRIVQQSVAAGTTVAFGVTVTFTYAEPNC